MSAEGNSGILIERDGAQVVLGIHPVAVNPAGFRHASGLFPSHVFESTQDLQSWTPVGEATRARIGEESEPVISRHKPSSNHQFYRIRTRLDFSGLDLSGMDLSFAELSDADLRDVDLSFADLRGANLTGAQLQGAKLTGANLVGATLDSAEIDEASLEDTLQLPTPDWGGLEGDSAFDSFGGVAPRPGNLGLAVGGANDVNNFRANIENDYLPLFTDLRACLKNRNYIAKSIGINWDEK